MYNTSPVDTQYPHSLKRGFRLPSTVFLRDNPFRGPQPMSVKSIPLSVENTKEIISCNPATGQELGRVPINSSDDIAKRLKPCSLGSAAMGHSFVQRPRAHCHEGPSTDTRRARIHCPTDLPGIRQTDHRSGFNGVIPTLDLMQFFARNTKKILKPEKLDIGLYRLLGAHPASFTNRLV